MTDHNIVALPAVDRPFAYRWLAGLFSTEISAEALEIYKTAEGQTFLNVLTVEPTLGPIVAVIRNIAKGESKNRSLDLASAYARLFLGAGGPNSAPPYESAYVSERGTLFQKSTAEMTDILRQLDLSVTQGLKEPPDHIAVQLNVMAELADRSARAGGQNDAVVAEMIERQTAFIDNHLLTWLPAFRDDCIEVDTSNFYGTLATATVDFVSKDRAWLSNAGNSI